MDEAGALAPQVREGTRGEQRRATRYSALLGVLYLVLSSASLLVAASLARPGAGGPELLPGHLAVWGFVLVGGGTALVFGVAHALFLRLLSESEDLARRREALVLAERRALVGTFAATIAHDFTNLLTVVTAAAEELREVPDLPANAGQLLDDMVSAVARGTELAARLGRSGARDLGVQREVELVGTVRDALRIVRSHLKVKRASVRFHGAGPVSAVVYPALVEQILMNLVINAADALDGPGVIEVRLHAEGDEAILEVHDSGPGIPDAQKRAVFDPFYTTKSGGAGLGLASVRLCADLHRGRVEALDSPLGGACVRVTLPRRPGAKRTRAAS